MNSIVITGESPKLRQATNLIFLIYFLDLRYLSYELENIVRGVICTYDEIHPWPLDLNDILGLIA